jgi:hypothetical protein
LPPALAQLLTLVARKLAGLGVGHARVERFELAGGAVELR